MYELAVCTMIKGENSHLPEWIAYHSIVGVGHFYVYDNESPVPLTEALEPEIRRGTATVVPISGRFKQLAAFNDGLKSFGSTARWMAFIDLDEFLLPVQLDSMNDVLRDYEPYGGLGINWHMFGSSGHQVRPPGLQIEAFIKRAEKGHPEHRAIKSVVRPEAVDRIGSAHHAIYRPGQICVNENHVPFRGHPGCCDVSVEKVRINHYYTRSRQEYAEKLARGRVDHEGPLPYTFEQIDASLNSVRDETILRFAPKVKAYLEGRERFCG